MFTKRSTPRGADNRPLDGWFETRFWVGIFGALVTAFAPSLGRERVPMSLATRRSP